MGVLESGRSLMAASTTPVGEDVWRAEIEDFRAQLAAETSPDAIQALLDEDELDELPIEAKTAAYERLLDLGVRTPDVLRAFADHLWLHGPQDDDRVEALRAEADGG